MTDWRLDRQALGAAEAGVRIGSVGLAVEESKGNKMS